MVYPFKLVGDNKVQVVIFCIGINKGKSFQLVGHGMFPDGAVGHHVAEVAFGGAKRAFGAE